MFSLLGMMFFSRALNSEEKEPGFANAALDFPKQTIFSVSFCLKFPPCKHSHSSTIYKHGRIPHATLLSSDTFYLSLSVLVRIDVKDLARLV